MSRQAHERKHHRSTSQILHEIEAQLHQASPRQRGPSHVQGLGELTRRLRPSEELGAHKTSATGPHQRSRTAALSGSHPKVPGSAGGYLLPFVRSDRSRGTTFEIPQTSGAKQPAEARGLSPAMHLRANVCPNDYLGMHPKVVTHQRRSPGEADP
jgi:hypothetical protein